jgi:hypothetical protein
MSNTYCYQIAKVNDEGIFRVTEADGPAAPATGNYTSLEDAQKAISVVAGKALEFESAESYGVTYWVAEFASPNCEICTHAPWETIVHDDTMHAPVHACYHCADRVREQ